KINPSIAPDSRLVVYLGFANTAKNLLSASGTSGIGEAPQLSSPYGEYDDGADVFNQYGGGGGLGWSKFTFIGGTWSDVNGYLQQTNDTGNYGGGPAALIEGQSYGNAGNYIIESLFNFSDYGASRAGIMAVASPTSASDAFGYRFMGQQSNNNPGFISFINDGVGYVSDGSYSGSTNTRYVMQVVAANSLWSANLYLGNTTGQAPVASLLPVPYTGNNLLNANGGFVGISAASMQNAQIVAAPMSIDWFRMRAYPPNGVMPSVSFGGVLGEFISLSMQRNPTVYGRKDNISAASPSGPNDGVDLLINGNVVATGTGSASYTLCNPTCPNVGAYAVNAININTKDQISRTLVVRNLLPQGTVHYVNITVYNNQSAPTAAPFQQMIQVNSTKFMQYEANNLQNVRFSLNGSVLNSWIERGPNSTDSNTIYWINISSGIDADSYAVLQMDFGSTSTSYFNGQSGEAP
ncbi:hypothetical protein M1590_04190, partial [Candidatus Marsarchaeota archaeon]|nr:hypothetical protein [Candidatus Marsarchaeota archaeon]